MKGKKENDKKWEWIAYIALFIIIISLLFIGMKLTGYATSTGTGSVNITVTSTAQLTMDYSVINFSTGVVNSTSGATPNATLESNGTAPDFTNTGTWTWTASNFTIRNSGNVNMNISNFSSTKNATGFIGGSNPAPQYNYMVINVKQNSCQGPYTAVNTWNAFNYSAGENLCQNLSADSRNNTIAIYVQLVIPPNSNTGVLADTVTITGTSIA